jgi:hypothetical protein
MLIISLGAATVGTRPRYQNIVAKQVISVPAVLITSKIRIVIYTSI